MDVIFLSPGYPAEMPHFTRGLAEVGARVWGVGGDPVQMLPHDVQGHLSGYLQVPRIMDEADVVARVRAWLGGRRPDRIETVWEPLVILAAKLREALGVPGMSVDTVLGFRDKELMKRRVRAHGLRVPHSARARTADECFAAAERIGLPLIVKPIAGAGSADTYRCDDAKSFAAAVKATRHVPEVSVEEFIDGEEFTYDTICVDGRPVYENVAQYLPRPLIARQNEWISPVICTIRDLNQPYLADGIALGRGVLDALNMGTGFTHMEWYRTSSGEVIFGEIGARVGGARLIDQMNFTSDVDLYREWARAVCWKSFEADVPRTYNAAIVFKRAMGNGRIVSITGLDAFLRDHGLSVAELDLLPIGAHRRDWKQTLVSDGYAILRHPDFQTAVNLAELFGRQVQLFAQ